MRDPLFSIIIPCYNQAHFLPYCLDSLLSQDFPDWEAIVVNDGSSDNTEHITKSFAEKDQRIKYIYRENGGLSAARNTGLNHSSGDYIIFLDGDDWLYAGLFSQIRNNLPFEWIQFGSSHFTNDGKKNINTFLLSDSLKKTIPEVLQHNLGPVHSFFLKRQIQQQVGFFDETLKSAEDWDFWIRVAKSDIPLRQISFLGAAYRLSATSMSRNASRMYDALKTVALRAVKTDSRLPLDLRDNRDYPELDVRSGIQRSLAMCLGVSVMQGKLDEAISLYKNETAELNLEWTPDNFDPMCSYLSFRYRYSNEDINWVLRDIYPYFTDFFVRLDYKMSLQKACVKKVFMRHLKVKNKQSYGILTPIINKLILND